MLSSLLVSFSHCIYTSVSVNIPTVSYFFYNSLTLYLNFNFSITTSYFFVALSSFLASFIFQSSIFVRRHVNLSLRDEKAVQHRFATPGRTGYPLYCDRSVTDLIGVVRLVTECLGICYFHSVLWTGEQAISQLFNANCWVSRIQISTKSERLEVELRNCFVNFSSLSWFFHVLKSENHKFETTFVVLKTWLHIGINWSVLNNIDTWVMHTDFNLICQVQTRWKAALQQIK